MTNTRNQQLMIEMVNWIAEYLLEHGYPPAAPDIAAGMEKSLTTVYALRREARALKMLDYDTAVSRSYQVPGVFLVDKR